MTQLTINRCINGAFTAPLQSQEFNVANKKDFGDKRLDLQGTFSAAGVFGGGTLLVQGWDGVQWNGIAALMAPGSVRVGPSSALNYRVFLSGGSAPNITWWLQSELWFEAGSAPPPPPPPPPPGPKTWDSAKAGTGIVLSNGDLTATLPLAPGQIKGLMAITGATAGKFYWEVTCDAIHVDIGVAHADWVTHLNDSVPIYDSNCFGYYSLTGKLLYGDVAYGAPYTGGDIIGVAVDLDNHKIWFSKNGVWQASGNPAAGTNPAYATMPPNTGLYYPAVGLQSSSSVPQVTANFGGSAFAYPVPAGFTAGAPS